MATNLAANTSHPSALTEQAQAAGPLDPARMRHLDPSAPPSRRGRMPSGLPNPIDVHVGQRLRLRRTLLGISQEELGRSVGLSFQQIQKYEQGANRIGASRLWDLSIALGVPMAYFFEEMDEACANASPRHVTAETQDPPRSANDPMSRRETLELVRAYYSINDHAVRRRIIELARSLGPDEEMGEEEAE